jgi:V8-like Glu-specific endopeptidase
LSTVSRKKPASTGGKFVNHNYQYPYSSIGLITCELADQKQIGTGFLIGPNLALTCAQNIWSQREKSVGKNITFTPAFKNSCENIVFSTKNVYFPEDLNTAEESGDNLLQLNFAVLELDCGNIEHDFGTLGLNFEDSTLNEETLSIIGFNRYGNNVALC